MWSVQCTREGTAQQAIVVCTEVVKRAICCRADDSNGEMASKESEVPAHAREHSETFVHARGTTHSFSV